MSQDGVKKSQDGAKKGQDGTKMELRWPKMEPQGSHTPCCAIRRVRKGCVWRITVLFSQARRQRFRFAGKSQRPGPISEIHQGRVTISQLPYPSTCRCYCSLADCRLDGHPSGMVGEDHRTCVGGDIEHHVVQEETRKKQEERARTKTNAEQKKSIYTNSRSTAFCGPILYNI